MIKVIEITNIAKKDLKKIPDHIRSKFHFWVIAVEENGIDYVRKIKSFHDEPLHGKRFGQRSIRLSKAYRAIYSIKKTHIEFLLIEEVNKHEY